MANPSWSTNNISFSSLPGDYMIGGTPDTIVEDKIVLETGAGVRFQYLNFTRRIWEIVFEVNPTQLATHRTFALATVGGVEFYFSLNGVGSLDSVLVTREGSEWRPDEMQKTSQGIRTKLHYRFEQVLT